MLPKKPAALSSPTKGTRERHMGREVPELWPSVLRSHTPQRATLGAPAQRRPEKMAAPGHHMGSRRATRMNPVDPRSTSSMETAVLRATASWRQETRERCDWGFPVGVAGMCGPERNRWA